MAVNAGTTSSAIEQMYSDIVADLVPYYMDAVLLPNQQIILNSHVISGQSGNTLRIPLVNEYRDAVTVTEGESIVGTASSQSNLVPLSANITVAKRGIATNVTTEALEDGMVDSVRTAVLTRLSSGLALATDAAGFATAKAGFTTHTDTGEGGSNADFDVNFVMSPEALAFAAKREPSVNVWFNNDRDQHEFRGSVRNGFVTLRAGFGQKITSRKGVGNASANIIAVAKGVANLRTQNAPTLAGGQYVSVISPAFEYAIQEQIALAGGSTISSLSDVGNRALLQGLIGQAAGVMFWRSNSLPNAA
jgi:hypothetical protein